jgi:NAD(P)H-hydrate epimerase
VASAASAVDVIAGHMPELMTRRLPETRAGSIALAALEDPYLVDLVATASVVALGPGLGRDPETAEFVRKLVAGARVPIILDADGIDAFTGAADMLPERSQPIVLTPHPGEMAGLVGSDAGTLVSSRLEVAREFAAARGVAIVLKGFRTVIAMPDGWAFVNPTGNPGMATAGSGDVLTGMIAALVGQPHLGTFRERVCLAVYLHGLAGDLAVETLGEECLTARDLIAFLPRAWAALRSGPDD